MNAIKSELDALRDVAWRTAVAVSMICFAVVR